MTTYSLAQVISPITGVGTLAARSWRFNRTLTLAVLLHLTLIPVLLVAMLVEPRVITGANGWIKPLKFAISGAVYGATLLWLLTFVQGRPRLVSAIAGVTGVALIVETALISMQVLRNTASHFNVATTFDGAVFGIMGTFIMLLAMANFALAVALGVQRLPDPVAAAGIRWGLAISLTGMMAGVLMTSGNLPPSSLAAARVGEPVTIVGAHSVGVDDGGPGLPFLGWSTVGGDLRVGHFVGLHGLQALPFLAFMLTRGWAKRRLRHQQRVALTWIGGAGYLGLTLLLTWQALRAQPLIAPDVVTLTAAALLATAIVAAVLMVLGIGMQRTVHTD